MRLRMVEVLGLAAFIAIVAAAATFGASFRPGPWYEALAKPGFTPPNWVFGPVWTVLYALIAIAGWSVWRGGGERDPALVAWGIQIVLNAAWSWLFFGQRSIGIALIDIALLWCAILAFILATRRTSPIASWLFVPYLAWVSYAAALNLEIWRRNG